MVGGKVGGVPGPILLDTGADISLIRRVPAGARVWQLGDGEAAMPRTWLPAAGPERVIERWVRMDVEVNGRVADKVNFGVVPDLESRTVCAPF